MKWRFSVVLTVTTLFAIAAAQAESDINSVLDQKVAVFDLTDATVIDGLSQLSAEPISGLHLESKRFFEPDFLTCLVPPLSFLSSWKARQYDGFSMIFARETIGINGQQTGQPSTSLREIQLAIPRFF